MAILKLKGSSKFTPEEMQASLDHFNAAAHAHYGNYAFSAGYLGVMLVNAMQDMPRWKQAEILVAMMQTVAQLSPPPVIETPTV